MQSFFLWAVNEHSDQTAQMRRRADTVYFAAQKNVLFCFYDLPTARIIKRQYCRSRLRIAYDIVQGICGQRRPRSACASAQSDQDLRYPLTESLDSHCRWVSTGENVPSDVRQTKTQISLCIRAVSSVFVLRMKTICIVGHPKCAQLLDCANAQADLNLRWTHLSESRPSFVTLWPSKMRPVKILIRLRECADWSESSLGTPVRKYFLTLWIIYYFLRGGVGGSI